MSLTGFSWNGVDVGESPYDLMVTRYPVARWPRTIYSAMVSAVGAGSSDAINHGERTFKLPCQIQGSDLADITSKFDALSVLMNPFDGAGKFELPQFPDRYYLVDEISQVDDKSNRTVSQFTLRFKAMDPYGFDLVETEDIFSIDTSPKNIDTSVVSGTMHCDASYLIRNESGGVWSGTLTITNQTYNNFITLKPSIPDGHWIRIGEFDSLGRYHPTITQSTASGGDPDALTFQDTASSFRNISDWPRFKYGVANTLNVTATGLPSSEMRVRYRGRHLQ